MHNLKGGPCEDILSCRLLRRGVAHHPPCIVLYSPRVLRFSSTYTSLHPQFPQAICPISLRVDLIAHTIRRTASGANPLENQKLSIIYIQRISYTQLRRPVHPHTIHPTFLLNDLDPRDFVLSSTKQNLMVSPPSRHHRIRRSSPRYTKLCKISQWRISYHPLISKT